jgi:hypothetical protein
MVVRGLAAFGRFWYHFVVGDDWTVAASIGLALLATYALLRTGVAVWWLVPLVAILVLGISLLRARSRT